MRTLPRAHFFLPVFAAYSNAARGLGLGDADDVAREIRLWPSRRRRRPYAEGRHRVHVVGTGHGPGREPADVEPFSPTWRRPTPLVHAQGGHHAEVAVVVVHQRAALHGACDVVRQALGLTHRVLGVGRAELALARGEVRDRGAVTGGEDVVQRTVAPLTQVCQRLELAHHGAALGDHGQIRDLGVRRAPGRASRRRSTPAGPSRTRRRRWS